MPDYQEGFSTVVMIPTKFVLAFPLSQLPREALKVEADRNYCIEQLVPWSAEEITSQVIGNRTCDLLIVAGLDEVNQKIRELEHQGAWISAVVPDFLLAFKRLQSTKNFPSNYEAYVQESPGIWNYANIENGEIVWWEWINDIELLDRLSRIREVARYVVSTDTVNGRSDTQPFNQLKLTQLELAEAEATLILQGKSTPIVDLRSKRVPTKSPFRELERPVTVAIFSMIASIIFSMFFLIREINQNYALASSCRAQQSSLFKEKFPSSRVPIDISSRLRSELKKYQLTDIQAERLPKIQPALPTFLRFLAALPEKGEFRFDSLAVDGVLVVKCKGVAKSLVDLEIVLESLKAKGAAFANPSLSQLDGGFYGFQIDSMQVTTEEAIR